jgi:CIC family chloride channel protein
MSEAVSSGLQAEVEEYLENKVARRRLFPRAVVVGVMAGAIAVGFRVALHIAELGRAWVMRSLHVSPLLQALFAGAVVALGVVCAFSIGRLDKDAGGSGIPHMKAVLEGHATMNWSRLLWVKFTAAIAALGSGMALGREGPTVQMGGALGTGISELTGASGREKRALIASGTGAGLAAAFNAPLAGVTFVLEELQRDFQPVVFGAALLSAAVATVISRLASGSFPVFTVPHIDAPPLGYTPIFIVLGVACGFGGVLFNKGLLSAMNVLERMRGSRWWLIITIMGILGAIGFALFPPLLGGGHELSEAALKGEILLLPAIGYFAFRMAFIHTSYATGVPGGIFAPLLSLGALAGVVAFQVTNFFFPGGGLSVAACVVVGMCGLFSGVVRAPLTAIILIGEMTGSYDLLLPLLMVSFTAYAVADGLNNTPIYEALLQREADRKGWDLMELEPSMAEFEVRAGSKFVHKTLRDLKLPKGVVIVLCRAEGKEFVPDADTVLHEHMRIVVATSRPDYLRAVAKGAASSD